MAAISHRYGRSPQDRTCLGSPFQEPRVAAALGGTSLHRDLARASLPPPVCLTQARWSCLHFLAISLLCSAQHLALFSFSPRFSWGFRRDARWVLLMRSEGDLLLSVNEARQELIGQYQRAVNNISVLISSAQKSKQGLHPVSKQGRHLHHVTHLLLPWLTLGSVGLRWGFPAGFGTTFPCIKIHAKSIIAVFRPACLTASTVLPGVQLQGLATKRRQVVFKTGETSFQGGSRPVPPMARPEEAEQCLPPIAGHPGAVQEAMKGLQRGHCARKECVPCLISRLEL